jgi:hypothetical protein
MSREINAVRISDTEYVNILVDGHNTSLYINDKEYSIDELRSLKQITVHENDVIEYRPTYEVTTHYVRGDETMSVDEYRKHPTGHDEDTSDEDILRAIANKKMLDGFEPVKEASPPERYTLNVVGVVCDTGSKFIKATTRLELYANTKDISYFTLYPNAIALDEYKKLAEKYSNQAHFTMPENNRGYLRFCQVNGSYLPDNYPFAEHSRNLSYSSVQEAQDEEESIRAKVNKTINSYVFNEELTKYKAIQVANDLRRLTDPELSHESMIELSKVMYREMMDYVNTLGK